MRTPLVAMLGCVLLHVCAGDGWSQAAAPAAAGAGAGSGIQFENPALPKPDRDVLSRAAQLVSRWAMVQRVVQAVKTQEAAPLPMERVTAIDEAWQRGEDPEGLASALAMNECSLALQTLVSANPGYAEAFVTDDRGVLVCMSQRTNDYFQGDEESWKRAFADGAGGVFVSKLEHDASINLDVVYLSVPIKSAGKVIGVLIVGRIVAPG
jgi:hypothetical protein